jgi:hypothetical protein
VPCCRMFRVYCKTPTRPARDGNEKDLQRVLVNATANSEHELTVKSVSVALHRKVSGSWLRRAYREDRRMEIV